MRLLKNTDVKTLPLSLVNHLVEIKALVQAMNPGIRDGYISDMLNSALKKRVSTIGSKNFIEDLAKDNFNEAFLPLLKESVPDKRFTRMLKHEGGQAFLTNEALMLLLEDGLHPLASLSGWNLHSVTRRDAVSMGMAQWDTESVDLLLPHREQTVSPFYECALLMLEDKNFIAAFSPQRAARQLRRFAPQLSKDNDLLAMLHAHFFKPKSMGMAGRRDAMDFTRTGPIEHRLLWALGRIIDLSPELDTGRIGGMKWPQAIINRWVRNGLISELPENQPVDSFLDDLERYPHCMTSMAIRCLAYHENGHPLQDSIEKGYVKEITKLKGIGLFAAPSQRDPDSFTITHHFELSFRPDLAERVGTDYLTVHKELFTSLWQFCDLDFIDYVLADLATVWGHPLPSQDPHLVGLNIWSRHPQWFENVKDRLPDILEPYLQNKSVLPPALLAGVIPLSVIPQPLIERFVLTIMDRQLPKMGYDRLEELLEAKRVTPEFVVENCATRDLAGALPARFVDDDVLEQFVSGIFKARLTDTGFKRIRELLELKRISQEQVVGNCPHQDLTTVLPVTELDDHLVERYVTNMLKSKLAKHEFEVVKFLTDENKTSAESILSQCCAEDLEALAFRGILKPDILNSPRMPDSLRANVLESDLGL